MTAVTIDLDGDHIPVLLPLLRAAALKTTSAALRAELRGRDALAEQHDREHDAWHALRVALEKAGERE